MVGDMPTVKEKDGKELSEKEALAHREKVYNGVEGPAIQSSSSLAMVPETAEIRTPRRVEPGEVQLVRTSTQPPVSPVEERHFTRHRAFSFEEEREEGVSSQES